MGYVRGDRSIEVEVSRIQSHMENWSLELDGEKGMIREWRKHETQRDLTLTILKGVAWVMGPASVIQLIVLIVKLAHGTI